VSGGGGEKKGGKTDIPLLPTWGGDVSRPEYPRREGEKVSPFEGPGRDLRVITTIRSRGKKVFKARRVNNRGKDTDLVHPGGGKGGILPPESGLGFLRTTGRGEERGIPIFRPNTKKKRDSKKVVVLFVLHLGPGKGREGEGSLLLHESGKKK